MTSRAASPARTPRGHTLIELMIAIVCGMILVLAAFTVLADFEGGKRTTTAMNDAIQSGNVGLFQIDKLVRSAGTGMNQYARLVGYGCALNYTPTGGVLIKSGVITAGKLLSPFAGVAGTTSVVGTSAAPLRLVPALIFGGASAALGSSDSAGATAATSDVLLFMLGGAGFGEIPVAVSNPAAPPTLQSIVGFGAGDWVVDGGSSLGDCMISKVASSFTAGGGPGNAGWTSTLLQLPLTTINTVGNKTLTAGDYIFDLGNGTAANFLLFGVDSATATLRSIDLLNSNPTAAPQNVSDDVVLLKAVYEVDPDNTGNGSWVLPGGSYTSSGTTYNYSATSGTDCLLCGTSNANLALQAIRAIRVAVVVRAPIQENANQSQNANIDFNSQSVPLFSSLPSAVRSIWYPPRGTAAQPQNYRYREIETTVPVRNNGLH